MLRCCRKIRINTEQDSLVHGSHRLFVGLITSIWLHSPLYNIRFASNLQAYTVYLFWTKEARNRTYDRYSFCWWVCGGWSVLWREKKPSRGDHPAGCCTSPYDALVLSTNMVILEGVK